MFRALLLILAFTICTPVFATRPPKLDVSCTLFPAQEAVGDVVKATIYYDPDHGQHVLEAVTQDSGAEPLVYWLTKFHHNRHLVHARDEHGETYIDLEVRSRDSLEGKIVLEQDFEYEAVCTGYIDLNHF